MLGVPIATCPLEIFLPLIRMGAVGALCHRPSESICVATVAQARERRFSFISSQMSVSRTDWIKGKACTGCSGTCRTAGS